MVEMSSVSGGWGTCGPCDAVNSSAALLCVGLRTSPDVPVVIGAGGACVPFFYSSVLRGFVAMC